jgi:hypothetical protein
MKFSDACRKYGLDKGNLMRYCSKGYKAKYV